MVRWWLTVSCRSPQSDLPLPARVPSFAVILLGAEGGGGESRIHLRRLGTEAPSPALEALWKAHPPPSCPDPKPGNRPLLSISLAFSPQACYVNAITLMLACDWLCPLSTGRWSSAQVPGHTGSCFPWPIQLILAEGSCPSHHSPVPAPSCVFRVCA